MKNGHHKIDVEKVHKQWMRVAFVCVCVSLCRCMDYVWIDHKKRSNEKERRSGSSVIRENAARCNISFRRKTSHTITIKRIIFGHPSASAPAGLSNMQTLKMSIKRTEDTVSLFFRLFSLFLRFIYCMVGRLQFLCIWLHIDIDIVRAHAKSYGSAW